MIRRFIVAVMLVILTLIAACAPPGAILQAKPLNNSASLSGDLCAGVACGNQTHCEGGECVCDGGLKKCSESCISQTACCINSDCPSDRTCRAGACVQRQTCGFGEEWINARQECDCAEDFKFCAEQGKCIASESCCWHTSCYDDQRCAPTTYAGTVCMQGDTKKCKIIHEGRTMEFLFQQGTYNVKMANILEGPLFDLKVNNDTTRKLRIDEVNTIDNNLHVFVEDLQVFGGLCKEEVD